MVEAWAGLIYNDAPPPQLRCVIQHKEHKPWKIKQFCQILTRLSDIFMIYLFMLIFFHSLPFRYSGFHIKCTWSEHSFNGVSKCTGSCEYLFHEIPSSRIWFVHDLNLLFSIQAFFYVPYRNTVYTLYMSVRNIYMHYI